MKVYGEVDVYIHIFLTSALAGGELSASRPGRFTTGTISIGGWVGSRFGFDVPGNGAMAVQPAVLSNIVAQPK
jgi:hypothetical protein